MKYLGKICPSVVLNYDEKVGKLRDQVGGGLRARQRMSRGDCCRWSCFTEHLAKRVEVVKQSKMTELKVVYK